MNEDTTIAEIEADAQAWYERELQRCAAAHGDRWPEHREWIEGYLREELQTWFAGRAP